MVYTRFLFLTPLLIPLYLPRQKHNNPKNYKQPDAANQQSHIFQLKNDIQENIQKAQNQRQNAGLTEVLENTVRINANQRNGGDSRYQISNGKIDLLGNGQQQTVEQNQSNPHQQILNRMNPFLTQHFDKEKDDKRKHNKHQRIFCRPHVLLVMIDRINQIDSK